MITFEFLSIPLLDKVGYARVSGTTFFPFSYAFFFATKGPDGVASEHFVHPILATANSEQKLMPIVQFEHNISACHR